jgi:hypothetical protein
LDLTSYEAKKIDLVNWQSRFTSSNTVSWVLPDIFRCTLAQRSKSVAQNVQMRLKSPKKYMIAKEVRFCKALLQSLLPEHCKVCIDTVTAKE